jgi:hypothetical protein
MADDDAAPPADPGDGAPADPGDQAPADPESTEAPPFGDGDPAADAPPSTP